MTSIGTLCRSFGLPIKGGLSVNSIQVSKVCLPQANVLLQRKYSIKNIWKQLQETVTPTHNKTQGSGNIDLKEFSLKRVGQWYKEEFGKMYRDLANPVFSFKPPLGVEMLFTFDHDESVDKFVVSSDATAGIGHSTASLVRTESDTGLFSGNIDTKPIKDGDHMFSGYAAMNSAIVFKYFNVVKKYDFLNHTHLVIKVRGDGRTYLLILSCPFYFEESEHDQYHYPLYTRGGPYWQLSKIPLSHFYLTSKGRIAEIQEQVEMSECNRIGITLADGLNGPFNLEIDYIGLENQLFHKAISPYENYYTKGLL